jgi:hypothetical protein
MFLTSDQALSDHSGDQNEVPRHFMVVSKPCIHPDAAPREGYIRGQYESVEFIREVPRHQPPKKSASAIDLFVNHTRNRSQTLGKEAILRSASKFSPPGSEYGSAAPEKAGVSEPDLTHSEGRARGKTISFDKSRGIEARGESMDVPREENDGESNPVEWIMITRSDPGGSVPRFMVERGTPGGIVSDAKKFLDWACAKDIEDFDDDDETLRGADQDEDAKAHKHKHNHDRDRDLLNYQTNGHLAGLEEQQTVNGASSETASSETAMANSGYYGMIAGAASAAGAMIAARTPQMIIDHLPVHLQNGAENGTARRDSVSTVSSVSSVGSFASALENNSDPALNDTSSPTETQNASREAAQKDKETAHFLQKLEDKIAKLNEKLKLAREKELSKKNEDKEKEEEALRKAEEKYAKEVQKQEEKYRHEIAKLEEKKAKEEKKAEERRRKLAEKDQKTRMQRELEEVKAEVDMLRKERQIMLEQVGALQAENTALAARVGRMVLMEIKDEVGKTGRQRASSLKGITRSSSFRTSGSAESGKDKETSNG